jgi:hypothetical protein
MVSAPMDALASIGDGRKEMIISPNKGIFFVATAVMCSAALYAAELSSPGRDPLGRVFVGVPNQLTLPPDFPEAIDISRDDDACDPSISDRSFGPQIQSASSPSSDSPTCAGETKTEADAIIHPGSLSTKGEGRAAPASLSTAVRTH